jgi:hypothetical protein
MRQHRPILQDIGPCCRRCYTFSLNVAGDMNVGSGPHSVGLARLISHVALHSLHPPQRAHQATLRSSTYHSQSGLVRAVLRAAVVSGVKPERAKLLIDVYGDLSSVLVARVMPWRGRPELCAEQPAELGLSCDSGCPLAVSSARVGRYTQAEQETDQCQTRYPSAASEQYHDAHCFLPWYVMLALTTSQIRLIA